MKFVGSGAPVRLTTHPADDIAPAWSPDGRTIAFVRMGEDEEAIYLISPLGGTERKLTDADLGRVRGVSWAPDGATIAFYRRDQNTSKFRISLIDVATRETRDLTTPDVVGAGDYAPVFSHDGTRIAFRRSAARAVVQLMVVSANGGEPTVVREGWTAATSGSNALIWSIDDRSILFGGTLARTGQTGLFRIPVDGGQVQHLSSFGVGIRDPAVSVAGRRLAFSQGISERDLVRITLPSDGMSETGRFAPSTRTDRTPDISPDGRRVAFISDRSGNREVWIVDSSGENAVQLTDLGGPAVGSPSWSPDGRRLAFDVNEDGYIHCYLVSAEGGAPRQITSGDFNHARPTFSHDGRWLYFNSDRHGGMTIWKMPAEGGEAVQLTERTGNNAIESPDGRYVYFGGYRSRGLWRVPVEGGEAEQISDSIRANMGWWEFSQDGTFLLRERR